MSNSLEPHLQIHGLPPRPIQSYQPPIRRRPRRKSYKLINQENQQSCSKPPRFSQSYRPLTDTSNMTTLPYNLLPPLAYQPPSKPPPFLFCPDSPYSLFGPTSWTLPAPSLPGDFVSMDSAYLHSAQSLRTGPTSFSRDPTDQFIDSKSNTTDTPQTRRRLAVEGVRKAVSDAALRKIGLHGGSSWDQALEKPISLNVEKQNFMDSNIEIQPGSEAIRPISTFNSDVQHQPYSPRQYTPKPLLLPTILALSHPTRSPPPSSQSVISPQRRTLSLRSRLSTLTCYNVVEGRCASPTEEEDSPAKSELKDLENTSPRCSTPPGYSRTSPFDSSFANDNETPLDSAMTVELDCSSTVPSSNPVSPDAKAKGIEFDIPSAKEIQSRPAVLEALMWTIAAPQKRNARAECNNFSASKQTHRKSLGFWLGTAVPRRGDTEHYRTSSETDLNPLKFSSPDEPIRMRIFPKSENSTDEGLVNRQDLSDKPVAQPTFILPSADTRKGVYTNLRNISSVTSVWPVFFRKPSLSFLSQA